MTALTSQFISIPNLITFARIILIPVFVTALVYQRYDYALALFVVASLTDMLDGLMARLTDQKTKLGAFLDPLADKVLLLTSFILFSVYGWVPTWLTITVISRDLTVTLGWLLLYLTSDITRVEPTFIGKTAIASQLLLIAYVLLAINLPSLPDEAPKLFMWIVAGLTIVSGLQYVYRGLTQNEK
ncbi:MAG TPA: CDP-alcohol phosphatidyltransferase family protein [Dissulfurispiraceae bacterium]|nr:CDP-alcohol phosphatidyltransferase family protein [Dissulfurispiraceae bacterium]